MKLVCGSCNHQVEISDSKVPAGSFKVKCPKCSQAIMGEGPPKKAPSVSTPKEAAPPLGSDWEKIKPFVETYINQKIEALRQELKSSVPQSTTRLEAGPDGHTSQAAEDIHRALVCETDSKLSQVIAATLTRMGYAAEQVNSAAEALRKIDQQIYEIVTVTPSFPDDRAGGKNILARINARKVEQRRRTLAVLISQSIQTAGPDNAFLQGANIAVNTKDLKNLETLIRQGQTEFQKLFQ